LSATVFESLSVSCIKPARRSLPNTQAGWFCSSEVFLRASRSSAQSAAGRQLAACIHLQSRYCRSGSASAGFSSKVKGDFCHKVRGILQKHGREADYIEINLTGSPYRYNPLWNDLDAYALAYGIATLLTSLFGKGREPFWQQAYTNMVKFIILLHRLL